MFLKEKNRPLAIREALAERFNLSTPPNLAFVVREAYNKQAPKMQPAPKEETQNPASPQPSPEPEQMGWDQYAQNVEDSEAPF
jgi:hypothetical protein